MSTGSRLVQRTKVGGSLAAAVAVGLWAAAGVHGPVIVLVVGSALAAWAAWEAAAMGAFGRADDTPGRWAALVAVAAAALGFYGAFGAESGLASALADLSRVERYVAGLAIGTGAALLLGGLALVPAWGGRSPRALARLLWIAVPLPMLFVVRSRLGIEGLVALILLSKVGDIAGYYVGCLLGKRFPTHPFPNVSPNKTAVGCWASLIVAMIIGAVLAAIGWLPEGRLGWVSGWVAGAVVNVAAQAGDLLESSVKRAAGVKDSGTTFGPSGGMLDLVDSLLLSVPAALVLWPWILVSPP